jgi:hypothetical protein
MERDTELGYGFLFLGYGMPFLAEKFLGEDAAKLAAVAFSLLGVGFLVAGHLHARDSKNVWKHSIAASVLVFGIVTVTWWIHTHPDMKAVIVGSCSSEVERRTLTTAILLNVDLLNSGPASITRDWRLTATLSNGEHIEGAHLTNVNISMYPDTSTTSPIDKVIFVNQLLDRLTATQPVPTGGKVRGELAFTFPGIPRPRIDNLDTELVLSFKDVRDRTYITRYHFPALSRTRFKMDDR